MPQLRTLLDSGVLLAAFKAVGELAENALAVLGDAERQFVSSDFVRLELLSGSRPFAPSPSQSARGMQTPGTALLAVRKRRGTRKAKTGPSACPRRPAADQKTNSPRQTSCALQARPTSRPCHTDIPCRATPATGDAGNSGRVVKQLDGQRITLTDRGGPPVLAEGISAVLTLPADPAKVRCFALDPRGDRQGAVPVDQVEGGTVGLGE